MGHASRAKRDLRSARRLAARAARRTPGLQAVVQLRDEGRRLRQSEQEAGERIAATTEQLTRLRARLTDTQQRLRRNKRKLAKARRRIAALQARQKKLASERNAARRELDRLTEAATWDGQGALTSVKGGGAAVVDLRSRTAAAAFVEALTRGEDGSAALVAYARALTRLPQFPYRYRLPALTAAFQQYPDFRPGIDAALALVAHHAGLDPVARRHLDRCGDDAVRLIPVEFAMMRIADDPTAAADVLSAVLERATPSPTEWLDILSAISASHDLTTLARATATIADQVDSWDADDQLTYARFAEYGERAHGSVPRPAADVRFGVMGYRRADRRRSSKNVGDFTQTLAVLGHVLRRSGLRLVGDADLVDVAHSLRDRIRPDLRIDTDDATVELVEVSRDDSVLDDVPPNTWYVAFGWHLHADVLGGHGLPYHPNLRPLFVAFHLNRRDMLTTEAIEYLRRYAPIGCRDWFTVDLLTYLGVPAFFTGCVTTTVDAYFEPADRPVERELPEGFVDSPPGGRGELMHQGDPGVRDHSLAQNLGRAIGTLDTYRARFGALTTSRLHCYLPATSIDIPTTFLPPRRFDVRFEGLIGPGSDHAQMRSTLRERLLEPVITAIVSGTSEPDVYTLWRSITEPMVEADVAERATAYEWPGTSLAASATRAIHESAWSRHLTGSDRVHVVDVCLGFDQNYLTQLYTVVDRILERTSRPLRLWALVRGLDTRHFEEFARAFPEVDVTFLPCDSHTHAAVSAGASRITVSTMDRLLLPDLLQDLDKVLYLDLDLLPRADIADLFDTPLGEAAIAARASAAAGAMGGVSSFAEVAHTHFPDDVEGWRLLNLVHRRSNVGDTAFNAGVLVMNLARMREDNFLGRYAGFAEQFGLNDQHVLNLYAGASILRLEDRWNVAPAHDPLDGDVSIVHWVGPLKPWGDTWVPFRGEWRAAVATMRQRRHGGPAAGTG